MTARDKELLGTIESCIEKLGLEPKSIIESIKEELELMKD